MLLFLLCAAANDDYVALKAFYESTGGSGWAFNSGWDMSNTDVCGTHKMGDGYDVQCTGTGGRVKYLCASVSAALGSAVSPLTSRRPRARRKLDLKEHTLSGTIPTEVGLLTELEDRAAQ